MERDVGGMIENWWTRNKWMVCACVGIVVTIAFIAISFICLYAYYYSNDGVLVIGIVGGFCGIVSGLAVCIRGICGD